MFHLRSRPAWMITRLFSYAHFGFKLRLRNIGSSVTENQPSQPIHGESIWKSLVVTLWQHQLSCPGAVLSCLEVKPKVPYLVPTTHKCSVDERRDHLPPHCTTDGPC